MISDTIQVGDRVIVTIPKDNRDWGYNPCQDGTEARVTGFSEIDYGRTGSYRIKPGIYVNNSWPKIIFDNGEEIYINSCYIDLVDKVEQDRRKGAFHDNQKKNPNYWITDKIFIRDLPETPVWEGDVVNILAHQYEYPNHVITRIDYLSLNKQTSHGSKYPAYSFSSSMSAGWHASACEDNIHLVSRGNIWKYYHNEPISFNDLREEMDFYMLLGQYVEMPNPITRIYNWTKNDILVAIKDGVGHSIQGMRTPFTPIWDNSHKLRLIKFDNEDLGSRVAQATLKGFGVA